jgi:hypothetical protein
MMIMMKSIMISTFGGILFFILVPGLIFRFPQKATLTIATCLHMGIFIFLFFIICYCIENVFHHHVKMEAFEDKDDSNNTITNTVTRDERERVFRHYAQAWKPFIKILFPVLRDQLLKEYKIFIENPENRENSEFFFSELNRSIQP